MKTLYTFFRATKKNLALIVTVAIFVAGFNLSLKAAGVTVTAPTNGQNVSADKAANAASPAFTTLNNIVITETAAGDIQTTATSLVLNAPAGWTFNTSGVTAAVTGGTEVAVGTITYTTTTITLPLTVTGTAQINTLTITGVQVKATDGGGALVAGLNITPTVTPNGKITGLTNGTTVLANLSQSLGAISQLVITLPGQTFTDATTKAASGVSGTVTGETAGTSFNILHITATD